MLVVMQEGATEKQIEQVIDRLVSLGFTVHRSTGVVHTVLGGVGPDGPVRAGRFRSAGRRQRGAPHHVAVQAGRAALPAREAPSSRWATWRSAAAPWW